MRSMNNLHSPLSERPEKELHPALGRAPSAPGEPMSVPETKRVASPSACTRRNISRHHKQTLVQEHGTYTLNRIADFSHEKAYREVCPTNSHALMKNADFKKKRTSYWSDLEPPPGGALLNVWLAG